MSNAKVEVFIHYIHYFYRFFVTMTKRRGLLLQNAFVVVLGWICTLAGIYLYFNWVDVFTQWRGMQGYLRPGTQLFSIWKQLPVPVTLDVYLFNWTNPQEFYRGSNKKPHFVELGPYRFIEIPDKVDIVWHTSNHSVSYHKKSVFHFDPGNSKGSLSDKITSVNTVALTTALKFKDDSNFQKMLVARTLKMYNAGVSITKTADEWLFTGYTDPLLTIGNLLSKFNKYIKVPYGRIGYLYGRNNSIAYEGYFNMLTGADDIRKLGQIHRWNYKKRNGIFEGECGQVKGSAGEFYPPNLTPQDTLWSYVPNLCQAIPLDYTESVQYHDLTAYKYSGGEHLLDNGTLFPSNKCFCVGGKCERSGVFNISPCAYNTSLYMSFPHFYKADPYYLDAIEGLKPKREKHEFFMIVEPTSGIPLELGGGFQINYLFEPIKYLPPFDQIPRAFIPTVWIETRLQLNRELTALIYSVPFFTWIGQITSVVLSILGVMLLCWYPVRFFIFSYTCPTQKVHFLSRPSDSTHLTKTSLHMESLNDEETIIILQQKPPSSELIS
uniref:Scavenger receptor class B n=1 Tax=Glossina palpalis gambiensis TaxID=67801 RepID=A0A1B0BTQ6_9MUSC